MKTMDLILVILGVMTVAFLGVMIYLFFLYQTTPDTLITCYFMYLVGECGIMGWIKNVKEKQNSNKKEDPDNGTDND